MRRIQAILLMIILIIFSATSIWLYHSSRMTLPANNEFIFDESFQNTVAHILAYEYMDIEGFTPSNFRVLGEKRKVHDDFSCDLLVEYEEEKGLIECIRPLHWKNYAFDTYNGSVLLGVRSFQTKALTEEYLAYLQERMIAVLASEQITGNYVENRAMIIPASPGPLAENIYLYLLNADDIHYLITLIESENTIFIIAEAAHVSIDRRRITSAFTPEAHIGAIERRDIIFIERINI
jgi:hypothetical protein